MELISVLIPTYNVENFIESSINSILLQSYSNLEIIIVDDASTDKTFDILTHLAQKDTRIQLYRNPKNQKIAATLNYAYSVSKGKFILRMDGDDVSLADRVQKLYDFLVEYPEFDLVGSNTITIDEAGKEISTSYFPIKEEAVYKSLNYRMSPVAHIWLARRDVYVTLKGYRYPPVEDYDFLLRAKTLGFRFTNLPEPLYKVRIRKGNTATTEGFYQRTAADFVYSLYKERMKYGFEKSIDFDKIKKSYLFKIQNFLHNISNNYLAKALVKRKNFLKLIMYTGIAILLSPITQTRYLYYRFLAKRSL